MATYRTNYILKRASLGTTGMQTFEMAGPDIKTPLLGSRGPLKRTLAGNNLSSDPIFSGTMITATAVTLAITLSDEDGVNPNQTTILGYSLKGDRQAVMATLIVAIAARPLWNGIQDLKGDVSPELSYGGWVLERGSQALSVMLSLVILTNAGTNYYLVATGEHNLSPEEFDKRAVAMVAFTSIAVDAGMWAAKNTVDFGRCIKRLCTTDRKQQPDAPKLSTEILTLISLAHFIVRPALLIWAAWVGNNLEDEEWLFGLFFTGTGSALLAEGLHRFCHYSEPHETSV